MHSLYRFRRTVLSIALIAALSLPMSACGPRPAANEAAETFTANLAVHHQLAPSPRTVALTDPVVRLGGSDAPARSAFGSVYGVLLDREDRLWVADRYTASISRFDAHAAFVDRVGRKGAGPGEFSWVQLLGWAGDNAVAWDGDLRRITLIPEGGGEPTSGPGGFGPRIVTGVTPARTQVFTPVSRVPQGLRRDAWISWGSAFEIEAQTLPSDSPSVVVRLEPLELYYDGTHTLLDPLRYGRRPVVFGDTVVAFGGVDADILVADVRGGAPVAFDVGGEPGTAFTPALREGFERYAKRASQFYASNFAPLAALSKRGYPARIPAFDDAVASREGVLWLHHWEDAWSPDSARWEVVTLDGEHLGTAKLPVGEVVVAANAHRVATLARDENGAAILREYENPFGEE